MVRLLPGVIDRLGQKMFDKYQESMEPDGNERIFNFMVSNFLLLYQSVRG